MEYRSLCYGAYIVNLGDDYAGISIHDEGLRRLVPSRQPIMGPDDSMMGAMSGGRVLVIGLDMGDAALLRHWSRAGRLPHLAALQASGVWLDLDSPGRVLHTSTWPTFATGTSPGRHGVYYPYQPRPGHQLAQHVSADQCGADTFWTVAAKHGRRALVYDVPETFPDPAFGGRAIFDWGTWAWYGDPASQPATLLKELESRFGRYPLGYEAKRLGLGHPDHIEERLLRSVRYKASTARWLLERDEWELAVIGFCETHPAGHYLWPRGADAIGAADERLFDPLYHVYAAVDEAIGTLRAAAGSEVTVIVTSGDGVRPNRCGWHLLPNVLARLGFAGSGGTPAAANQPPGRSLVGLAHGLIPASAKQLVTASLPWRLRDRLGVWLQMRSMDWSRTRAFTLPTDLEGCIRLNVKGREPRGIVESGAQYRDVCEEIKTRLLELENPATAQPAVQRVWMRNEVFPGPRQEQLPDMIVTWNDTAPIDAVVSDRLGSVEGVNPDPRPGTHSMFGFAVAAGGGISRGIEGRARLTDVAASVLSRLGIRDMKSLDGCPVDALTGVSTAPE
jgi:predicted AlkP superfamily phosphohydrolase/phosphomutase